MFGKIYLNVPYSEKESVKILGAKWDSEIKKWYYNGNVENYINFARWIACGREYTTIVFKYLYIIEGKRNCFRCRKSTRIIGLGFSEHITLYRDEEEYDCFINTNPKTNKSLTVTWVNEEEDIPPAILKYLKEKYNVYQGYSSMAGKCFSNHCDHCQAIQGNFHLFCEDSPLTFTFPDDKAIQKLRNLKIYPIKIQESLVIDWDYAIGNSSPLYLQHGNIENCISLNSKSETITYKELFNL